MKAIDLFDHTNRKIYTQKKKKEKLSASLNSVFNSFHDLKLPEPSSQLSRKLTFLSASDCR